MGQGSVKLVIFVAIITKVLIWGVVAFPQCKFVKNVSATSLAGNAEAVVGELPCVVTAIDVCAAQACASNRSNGFASRA